jgi:hypothetical protein
MPSKSFVNSSRNCWNGIPDRSDICRADRNDVEHAAKPAEADRMGWALGLLPGLASSSEGEEP